MNKPLKLLSMSVLSLSFISVGIYSPDGFAKKRYQKSSSRKSSFSIRSNSKKAKKKLSKLRKQRKATDRHSTTAARSSSYGTKPITTRNTKPDSTRYTTSSTRHSSYSKIKKRNEDAALLGMNREYKKKYKDSVTGKEYNSPRERRKAIADRRAKRRRVTTTTTTSRSNDWGSSINYYHYGLDPQLALEYNLLERQQYLAYLLVRKSRRDIDYENSRAFRRSQQVFITEPGRASEYENGTTFQIPTMKNTMLNLTSGGSCKPMFDDVLILDRVISATKARLTYFAKNGNSSGRSCRSSAIVEVALRDLKWFNYNWQKEVSEKNNSSNIVVASNNIAIPNNNKSEVINICGGSSDGNYTWTMDVISDSLPVGVKTKLITTNGSGEVVDKVERGICDFGIAQADVIHKEKRHGVNAKVISFDYEGDEVNSVYLEMGHLICNTKSKVSSIGDLSKKHTLYIPGGSKSGSSNTWNTMLELDKQGAFFTRDNYDKVKVVSRTSMDNTKTIKAVMENSNSCGFFMTSPNSTFLQGLVKQEKTAGVRKLQLVDASDRSFDDDNDGFSLMMGNLPNDIYGPLKPSSWGGEDQVETVAVPAQIIVNAKFKKNNRRKYNEFKAALEQTVKEIKFKMFQE
ncbi:MAG: hypothetical protein HON90_13480 [Halobacteriovoraceae bacterium]|nr:hypothetical protein [Halobacteriovoraceae bacterium]